MTVRRFTYSLGCLALALTLVGLAATPSLCVTFDLQAKGTTITMPDGAAVAMWGFGLQGGAVTVPGPVLTVPPGDTTITINLKNNLKVPVSIVIPGQTAVGSTPVRFTDGQGRERVRSFTNETAPGATGVYTWNNVKPGTYIYHSGTHPQVQVQMGLYGAVKIDSAAGFAYPGVSYQNELILFYSEIDRVLHNAVANGRYGQTPPPGADPALYPPSAFHYKPKYFLVNGKPFEATDSPVPAGKINQNTLVRLLNMGLREVVPTINNLNWSLFAEDGNRIPYHKKQYSALLGPGKTRDVILRPTVAGVYPVFDRRLNLTNHLLSPGGAMIRLYFGTP